MSHLKFIVPGVIVLLSLVCYQVYQRGAFTFFSSSNVERVDAEEAFRMISTTDFTILDVRDESEYDVSHLEGAIRYEEGLLEGLNANEPVMVYCTVGLRSNQLAKILEEEGFNQVVELQDGLIGWSNAELPLVNSRDNLTDSVHVYAQYFSALLRGGTPVY
ncbi:rhodanese-like domain-containing protein [Roseivirga sp. E12]|uniref:rhodanese-like domain-containing protein n=1 Tax=Roseivirga sp. E12 TaxID=2819237 RepID=UPI001ABC8C4D|nr:rhodanese-like domain-containing protein [Roseivirga sp. E12]MBO3699009.1 rhodanese-like domain-containing protein [Roseivirga sp. E12]